MNDAVCWSRQTGIPLFNGEFSSYESSTYTDQNPMLWNKTMVQLSEAEGISWTYFSLNGFPDPITGKFVLDPLWFEAGNVWNQPVLDALAAAHAEPVQPWATCADPTPAPSATPTSPAPTTSVAGNPTPPTSAALTSPAHATPVAVAPRFTG